MATYKGRMLTPGDTSGEVVVLKDGEPLTPQESLRVRNHSPSGFSWGYAGSGPAQLALAIMLDYFKATATLDKAPLRAQAVYQDFKAEYVAKWGDSWEITTEQIRAWLQRGYHEFIGNLNMLIKHASVMERIWPHELADKAGHYPSSMRSFDEWISELMDWREALLEEANGAKGAREITHEAVPGGFGFGY